MLIMDSYYYKRRNIFCDKMDDDNTDRPKCRCCGNDIFYDDTYIDFNNDKIKGHSYLTIKKVNGVEYHLTVCEECLRNRFDINNMSRTFNVMSEITKFAFDIPDEVYAQSRCKYAITKENLIKKYGSEEGEKRWKLYVEKQSETNTYEYKNKKYGWSKEDFDKYNKSRAITKENLIKKYGTEEGEKRWKSYVEKQSETKSFDYMVKKFGYEKAKAINKSKSQSLDAYIKRYGDEKGTLLYMKKQETHKKYFSKISQKLFDDIDKILGDEYTTYYATKNGEYGFNLGNKYIYVDFFIKELNICIEFNGTNFHADKRVFNEFDHPNPFNKEITAKEIWKNDEERYKELKQKKNVDTFVIWELDYNDEFNINEYIKKVLNINI